MSAERCPTCKQPIPTKPMRVCFDCGEQIRIHHKWTWNTRNGVLTCVHRHCDNPQSYRPTKRNDHASE